MVMGTLNTDMACKSISQVKDDHMNVEECSPVTFMENILSMHLPYGKCIGKHGWTSCQSARARLKLDKAPFDGATSVA